MFEKSIKHYADFPQPGVEFIDILPLLQDREAFQSLISQIDSLATAPNIVTIESRGFLFASPVMAVSNHIQALVPFRKKGKLPSAAGDLVGIEIEKEYGHDQLFYRLSDFARCIPSGDTIEVTVFDDVIATGGTVEALAHSINGRVVEGRTIHINEFIFLAELPTLGGRGRIQHIAPVHSIITF